MLDIIQAVAGVLTIATIIISMARSDYIAEKFTVFSKMNLFIKSCIHEGTARTMSLMKEQIAFKKATGVDESIEKIKVINKIYDTGYLRRSDIKVVANYLRENEQGDRISFEFKKIDEVDAGFSKYSSIFILFLICVQYASSLYETGNALISLIPVMVILPFMYLISDGYRRYNRAKTIQKMLKRNNLDSIRKEDLEAS